MFGLFKSDPFHDAQLGEFHHSGGHWKGSLTLAPFGAVPFVVGRKSQCAGRDGISAGQGTDRTVRELGAGHPKGPVRALRTVSRSRQCRSTHG